MQKTKRLESMQKALAIIGLICGGAVWYYGDRYGNSAPGVSGAAAGCGVIAAACITCIVWIELSTTKNQEKL